MDWSAARALLLAAPVGAEQIPLTDKIMLRLSSTEIAIHADTFSHGMSSQTLLPIGVVRLDGKEAVLSDGRTATASADAGSLAVTMMRQRNTGFVNVMREVYILNKNGDELAVWRTLNTTRTDGSQGISTAATITPSFIRGSNTCATFGGRCRVR